jgi:ribosomal protein S27E
MECKKCGSEQVVTEGLLDNKVKVTCQKCGESEIKDAQGRQMLTDDMPAPDRRRYLAG